jgi:thioredoxin 1
MADFITLINGDTPVLVDFHAEWCGPCKMMPPILQEVKKHFGEKIRIIKIDIDKNPSVANSYGIQSVPTLLIFRKGKISWRLSGVVPSSELIKIISSNS